MYCLWKYWNWRWRKCQKCNVNYKLATDKKSCIACESTETGDGENCYTVITNCLTGQQNKDTCQKCDVNYKLATDKKSCTACESTEIGDGENCYTPITNCEVYQDHDNCQKCIDNYKLATDKKSCIACESTETGDGKKCFIRCITNEDGQLNCFEKIDNCNFQQEDKCSQCNPDYELNNDKTRCISCTDGKKSDGLVPCFKIENCKNYYYYRYGNNNIYGCSNCESNSLYLTTAKQQCNNELGKFKLGTKLINEINNCLNQKSQTECTQCLPGYKIKNGKCYPCVEPYKGSDGKTCYLPHLGCNTDSEKCSSCLTGYKQTKNKQYCYLEGTNDPTNNSCNLLKLNILLLMIFGLL